MVCVCVSCVYMTVWLSNHVTVASPLITVLLPCRRAVFSDH